MRPAFAAITQMRGNVAQAQRLEPGFGKFGQRLVPFNGVHAPRQFAENCRLIARPRANFQHRLRGRNIERLRHHRNDGRHADGLLHGDGQRVIFIGTVTKLLFHELLTRNLLDGRKHARIGNAGFAQAHNEANFLGGQPRILRVRQRRVNTL